MAKIKINEVVNGAEKLSLGISMVVAVAIGVGLGFWLKSLTGWNAMIFVGLAFGIAAAALNVHKAYKAQIKSLDELKDENRYKGYKDAKEDDE
ncbi:AtpZ/AtpI family protein [Campylobacter sp. RM9344]|uniref:AtpZ/AtpI family protein n=1 Tax=Campylobacter californiensis TaxID=1032243 RepID=A0AAW3ZWS2_9BACT|nr:MULTISPECIES: AtpZ/AtpI family protein [unclassified Campylobacter]MBE2984829.1 AtpZ/AtpI family protein [Campylobacter sp. RM6883]MBE2986533.1 AtpZ/AtpI family protein [Campylobacter sp. RM12919]MBE2987733.1 AtpZ/AtpI family protein [Campylobacter sp. RM12920]MBE2994705.1 AtpZ/AtpI family protein [Campylobacter sp. RM6913]MBE3029571.1 AtpZ/AtpI family protein [Campylobacter sp. RM9344]